MYRDFQVVYFASLSVKMFVFCQYTKTIGLCHCTRKSQIKVRKCITGTKRRYKHKKIQTNVSTLSRKHTSSNIPFTVFKSSLCDYMSVLHNQI